MRTSLILATVASLIAGDIATAQPRPYGQAWGQQVQPPPPPRDGGPRGPDRRDEYRDGHHDGRGDQGGPRAQTYYYNGRWVDADEWGRHSAERDRWAQNYQRRRGDHDRDNSSALIAGIIGFALGAAIVGSQDQAEHARTADKSWDSRCARRYRSYDPRSRTYLGYDGVRRYCQ